MLKALAFSGLAAVASAHILMKSPVPFGYKTLNNSPLRGDGSDFPCKQRPGVYVQDGPDNIYKQGDKIEVIFEGIAVHGGGSCQFSLTTERKPNGNTDWGVIHTIEGGCPAKNQVGNLVGGSTQEVPDRYYVPIARSTPPGKYVFAWSWYNKVGGREMYMNCAPITIYARDPDSTVAFGDLTLAGQYLSQLPDMFIANVGEWGNYCGTTEMTDLEFPDPGDSVERLNGATTVFAGPTGQQWGAKCPVQTKSRKPLIVSSEAASSSTSTSTTSTLTTSTTSTTSTSKKGGVFITQEPTPSPVVEPETSEDGKKVPGTSCKNGQFNCLNDGRQFQQCVFSKWYSTTPVAPGAFCVPGVAMGSLPYGPDPLKNKPKTSAKPQKTSVVKPVVKPETTSTSVVKPVVKPETTSTSVVKPVVKPEPTSTSVVKPVVKPETTSTSVLKPQTTTTSVAKPVTTSVKPVVQPDNQNEDGSFPSWVKCRPNMYNCLKNGRSFQQCVHGSWVSMPLAPGAKCKPGRSKNNVRYV